MLENATLAEQFWKGSTFRYTRKRSLPQWKQSVKGCSQSTSYYFNCILTHRPVVVQVCKLVCQTLEVVWCQPGTVLNHVVMGWGHCSLTNRLADKEEVIPSKTKQVWANLFNQFVVEAPGNQNSIKISLSVYKQWTSSPWQEITQSHKTIFIPFFACDIWINDSAGRWVCQINSIPSSVENPGTDPFLHNDNGKLGSK